MSKECLTNQEVANKLGTQYTSLYHNEYSTVESCTDIGADSEKLTGYSTIYECPADDDIVPLRKYDEYCTPDHNLNPFTFMDDGNWRLYPERNPEVWLCDMDRMTTVGTTSSVIMHNDTLLGPGDLVIFHFKPETDDGTLRSILGIQDIDDGCIGLFYYENGAIMVDEVTWDSAKQQYRNVEKNYNTNATFPEWVAVWRRSTSADIYITYFSNLTASVNDVIDDVTTNYQNSGILWVEHANQNNGGGINSNWVTIGMPFWNETAFSQNQLLDIYWADPQVPRQVNMSFYGAYLKRGCM